MAADGLGNRELECKLGGTLQQIRGLKPIIEGIAGAKLQWSRDELISVYYDTNDRRLGGRKVTLRVRSKKGGFVQTVKSDGQSSGPLFDRGEWEQPVAALEPELDKLPADALDRVGLVLPGELNEVFRTQFKRQSSVITRQDGFGASTQVEIALDEGNVIAGEAKSPICECELELLTGDPRVLFEIAMDLQAKAGLKVLHKAKAARGYDLLDPIVQKPVKADKTPLRPDQTLDEAIAEILSRGLRQMLANEAPSYDGSDIEGVHQFRVAVRRMRSALSVFGKLLEPERIAWLREELKWVGEQFGPARDWDVFGDEILGPLADGDVSGELTAAGMRELISRAEAEQKAAYVQVRETLESPRYAALVLKLSGFVALRGWGAQPCPPDHPLSRAVSEVAPELLDRARKKCMKLGRVLGDLDVPERHELRIRIKKLRYNTDFLQGLYGEAGKKEFLSAMAALQDDFGHLNDVAVAERLVAHLLTKPSKSAAANAQAQTAAGTVMGWHARGLYDGEAKLLEDWTRFAETKPFWRD